MAAVAAADTSSDDATYRVIVLVTMACSTMLYSLTVTIVNIALPQLQGALSATQDQIAWVVTLNVIATAVATPLTGSLVSWFGRKRLLVFCITGFTLSSIACAGISSLSVLLFFRILQGLLGAPLVPLAQAIILQTWPKEMHAKANGYMGFSVVIGPAIAPTLGGYLAEEYNWRWVFLMIVPLGLAALLGVLRFIQESKRVDNVRFDYLGFALFSIAIVSLQLIMDRGERLDWYDSSFIIGATVTLVLASYMFVVNSFFAPKPFIDPTLFTNRNYAIGLVVVFIYGSVNFTPLVLLPPLLQNLKGYPDTLIGIVLAMRGVGMIVGFWVAARMGRLDPRFGLIIGMGCIGLSGTALTTLDLNLGVDDLSWISILQGFGCGVMWVPLALVTFSTLPSHRLPEASALFHLLRNLGTSMYVAFSVFLLVRTTKVRYAEMAGTISPYDERLSFPVVTGGGAFEWLSSLGRLATEVSRQSSKIGYNNCFYLYSLTSFAALPLLAMVTVKRRS